jgi:asparagine synthase (glutamine-hydrolysing)
LGGIAALVRRDSNGTQELLDEMLLTLKHRGTQSKTAPVELSEPFEASIGCASQTNAGAQFAESEHVILSLDGSVFDVPGDKQAEQMHRLFVKNPQTRTIAGQVASEPAAIACLCFKKKRLYAFRDLNGLKPLYYSQSRSMVALASERKPLWRIGMKRPQRILPGYLYTINKLHVSKTHVAALSRPRERRMTMSQATTSLTRLLMRSIGRITRNVDKVAVAFSGGLDSALTAWLAKQANVEVELISVGLPGSSELQSAEKFASNLDLPITVEPFSLDLLREYVQRIVWLIEEPSLMKVSIAVPLHWAAKVAAQRGHRIMLCGQGSDELYGGYYKYARTLDGRGRKALENELYRSVTQSAEVNYERDEQATAPFNIELRTIFADLDVIRFSLTIPSEFKVRLGNDLTRKWVLREVAKKLGLSSEIIWRRKKAIQHGTGVENAIRKLAKAQGLTSDDYLLRIQEGVREMESMP